MAGESPKERRDVVYCLRVGAEILKTETAKKLIKITTVKMYRINRVVNIQVQNVTVAFKQSNKS